MRSRRTFSALALHVALLGSTAVVAVAVPGAAAEVAAVSRLAGADRIATALQMSRTTFSSAAAVVLVRSDTYPDALAAAPLAARLDGPLLLTATASLSRGVAAEITRLGARTALVIGGDLAASPAIGAGLAAAGVTTVEPIAGADRYATAAAIARRVGGKAFLVAEGQHADAGRGWPDALAASAAGALLQRPVLLATADAVPLATRDALRAAGATEVAAVGGPAALSEAVLRALADPGDDGNAEIAVSRLWGPDRYATAAEVADWALARGPAAATAMIASGGNWPDALSAGAATAKTRASLLLVPPAGAAGSAASAWLARRKGEVERVVLVGGERALDRTVERDLAAALAAGPVVPPPVPRLTGTVVARDPFPAGSTDTFHQTLVEPDTAAWGATVVATYQVGRAFDGGATTAGWSTSLDGGRTWTSGLVPGLTTADGGRWSRVSDPAVAYDATHGTWLVTTLGVGPGTNGPRGQALLVSRSPDGVTWSPPAVLAEAPAGGFYDKGWVACDNHGPSPYVGSCYVAWDDNARSNLLLHSTSRDGGLTWSAPVTTAGDGHGTGTQLAVRPAGDVVVVAGSDDVSRMLTWGSADGGATWSAPRPIAPITIFKPVAGLRSLPLPSLAVDDQGRVSAAWHDCRYRRDCWANDIVLSTSDDGHTWSSPARVALSPVGAPFDHVIPGLDADGTGRLALTTYRYLQAGCTRPACELEAVMSTSNDRGLRWSAPARIGAPFQLGWLPPTTQGPMVGDYVSTSWVAGRPVTVVAVAEPATPDGLHVPMVAAADDPTRTP
ncbi:MAG TPA: cell wall-binding repeat-containing protein [Acidimicrobiales bacterium]|nr:cell wall-binding repeat-containing protein [Acidimicrobiales bacterium]